MSELKSKPSLSSEEPERYCADDLPEGSSYELSEGRLVDCMGTGGRGSRANLVGGSVLESDPLVEEAGVDTGFSPRPDTLRAPDIAVGNVPDEPGWVAGVPLLAVEYADTGQDEKELQRKILELLDAGTRIVWVVRLVGPRRVEIYEPGLSVRLAEPGEDLEAPGILKNPVPVLALYEQGAAHEATLQNLLQRRGYDSLDAVKEEARLEARLEAGRQSIEQVCRALGVDWNHEKAKFLEELKDSIELQELMDQVLAERRWPVN